MSRFCRQCGHAVNWAIPTGDNLHRDVCPECNHIEYDNPRMIAGTVCIFKDKILLAKRNIEPRLGYWTLPAGFMENGETTAEGAARETVEETQAKPNIKKLHSIISIPHISQVYTFYLAELENAQFGPTSESSDVKLFDLQEIPWDELAFPVITYALKKYCEQVTNKVEINSCDVIEHVIDRRQT